MSDVAIREGNRWVGDKPPGDEVAAWFKENIKLHEGMDHEDFVAGITLISQKEDVRGPITQQDQSIKIEKIGERQVHVPYPRVDARIDYFHKYVAKHGDWLGFIAPARVPRVSDKFYNQHLPEGFFRTAVQEAENKWHEYIGCSMVVRIFERASVRVVHGSIDGTPVAVYAPGTKVVPVMARYGPDENAVMKAETGAVGRALGMASMLIIPGSGVATAEDMAELLSRSGDPSAAATLGEPPAATSQPVGEARDLSDLATELISKLQSDHPAQHEQFKAWASEKSIDLSAMNEGQMRSAVRKAEQLIYRAAEEEPALEPAPKPEPKDEG